MSDKPTPGPALAVALKYDAASAPRVVAVGRGETGEKIIERAREHQVPLEVNAPLAEALSTIELDSEIPEALYKAVATVIAFVLKVSQQAAPPPPQHR